MTAPLSSSTVNKNDPGLSGDVVRFDGVYAAYDDGPHILKDVSFALEAGSLSFLTGPSGAGKSTLLKLIYMAHTATQGEVSLFGHNLAHTPDKTLPLIKRRIGVVFQEFRLIDHLSVFENVGLPLRVSGQPRRSWRQDVRDLLDWVGLGDQMSALPPTLSGGEKQRAAIARAVIAKPDLLIADEPTGNVDQEMATRLIHLFMELNRMGTTVIIATHNLDIIPPRAQILRLDDHNLTVTRKGRKS